MENQNEIRFNIPLIGEKFPELKVQTTKGLLNIPKDFCKKMDCTFQSSC